MSNLYGYSLIKRFPGAYDIYSLMITSREFEYHVRKNGRFEAKFSTYKEAENYITTE